MRHARWVECGSIRDIPNHPPPRVRVEEVVLAHARPSQIRLEVPLQYTSDFLDFLLPHQNRPETFQRDIRRSAF